MLRKLNEELLHEDPDDVRGLIAEGKEMIRLPEVRMCACA
jgi:hypothetical protein